MMHDSLQFVKNLFHNCFQQQSSPSSSSPSHHHPGSLSRTGGTESILSSLRINEIRSLYDCNRSLAKDLDNLHISSYDAISARNDRIRFPTVKTLDIIPRSQDVLNGDWILRYSDSETNNYPWSGESSPSFDLVPWRRSNPNANLLLAQSTLNSPKRWASTNKQDKKILERLHKIETKQVKKQLKDNLKYSKRVKRIRIMLSIEMRQKNYEILPPRIRPRQFEPKTGSATGTAKSLVQSHITRLAVMAAASESRQQHWGYFSQRTNENFKEKIAATDAGEKKQGSKSTAGAGEDGDALQQEIERHVFCKNMNAVKTLNPTKRITPFAPKKLESDRMIVQMCRKCRSKR